MNYTDTLLIALALAALGSAATGYAQHMAPQGMGRREYMRRAFWFVTFPLFVGAIALMALGAIQGIEALQNN